MLENIFKSVSEGYKKANQDTDTQKIKPICEIVGETIYFYFHPLKSLKNLYNSK